MRQISSAAANILATKEGEEPICFVQVFWTDDTNTAIFYGDRAIPEFGISGRVISMSNIESVVNITKASNTSAITITLDDSDGSIKTIFDTTDIINRVVWVYQWFTALPFSDAFVLFEGQISSPITWKEGDRTITFDVLSKIDDLQYGFSADQGDFAYIPEGIVGKGWPLPFGTTAMVPSLKLFDTPQGLLQNSTTGQSNSNANRTNNLWASYYKAFNAYFECITKALYCFSQADQDEVNDIPSTAVFILPSLATVGTQPTPVTVTDNWIVKANSYQSQGETYRQQAANILDEITAESVQKKPDNQLVVQNGTTFPQGTNTSLQIGSSTYTGQFSGNIFTVISSSNPFATDGNLLTGPLTITDSDAAAEYAADTNEQNFFYNVAGSAVTNSSQMVYVICLFEAQIGGVYADYNGVRSGVPSTYYSISYVDFGDGIQCTYLTMNTTLPLIDKLWSDAIYCDITSPVGPNTVDILIWLIGQYTTFGYDVASFTETRVFVDSYPANFALLKTGNIVKLLQEIAFQARCALWYKQGLFYIKFLADMTSYVDTITEDDVESGTLEISCTPTEELVTKYTATYTADGVSTVNGGTGWVAGVVTDTAGNVSAAPVTVSSLTDLQALNTGEDLVIWYYNVQAYGLIEKTDPYYIYNIPELVELASMFWLVRYTNTWKRIKFSTFLTHLDLETFDYVLLDFMTNWVSDGPVVGMVESCQYDSANERVELTVWLPIRFGEMTTYPFATPYNISPTLVFPEEYQSAGTTSGPTTGTKTAPGHGANLIPPSLTNAPPAVHSGSPAGGNGGVNPSNDGFETPTFENALDPSAFNTQPNTSPSGTTKQYVVKPVQNPDLSFDSPGVYPGIVGPQLNGSIYNVTVYFSGFIQAGSVGTIVPVTQLLIDPDDIIPPGTPAMVTRNRVFVSTDPTTGFSTYTPEYTMCVPIWLLDNTVPDLGVPPTDFGSGGGGDGGGGDENEGGGPSESGGGDFSGDSGSGGDF